MEDSIFKLNDELEIKVARLGVDNRSVVIVDNFYKYPDKVRELALQQPLKNDQELVSGFPGWRTHVNTIEVGDELYDFFLDLCIDEDIWQRGYQLNLKQFDKGWESMSFMCNVLNDESLIGDPLGIIPHQDNYSDVRVDDGKKYIPNFEFGSVIYLNTPEECAGGTNIYSWDGTLTIPKRVTSGIPKPLNEDGMSDRDIFEYVHHHLYHNERWKVVHQFEMVYNRMCLYQSDNLHGQWVDLGMFTDYNRLNQVLFM